VIAVLGGLGAAFAWGLATLASARASRGVGPARTLAWASIVGFVACLPLVAATGTPRFLGTGDEVWLALVGLGYIGGLLALYAAITRGAVGVAAPIASAEGGIAAVIAIVLGEPTELLLVVALAVVVGGVVLATLEPDATARLRLGSTASFLPLALASAILLGISLYAAGRISGSVEPAWVAMAGRLCGVVIIALPLLVTRRLRVPRSVAPFLVVIGLLEPLGYFAFVAGAGESISVAAVLASQFAVVATLGALLLGEHLAASQRLGVLVVALGVAAVALISTT
jgi:drug/metabolite transporter (DMT)-like permease